MNPARRLRTLTACLSGLFAWGALTAATPAWAQSPKTPEPPGNSGMSAPLFYQLLLGELNVRGGDPGAGYSLILDAARQQKDPVLYRRAVDIALQARSGDAALAAARAWSQALPDSLDADRFVLQISLALGRVDESATSLRAVLQGTPESERNDAINSIPQSFSRVADKAQALKVVREALAPFLNQPVHAAAAWTTIGRMELAQDRVPEALAAAQRGHQAERASPYPAVLALELIERGNSEAAETIIRQQIDAAQGAGVRDSAVALGYARVLLDLQRMTDARVQLERLTTRQPQLPEPWLLLGSLQVQDKALPAAAASLETYMRLARAAGDARSVRGLTQAYLLMADIAERQSDFVAANAWLDRIENPDDVMAAQLRRASLLARQGRLAEGRALLRSQPERRPEDARLKLVAEAQLLKEFKAWRESYEVYGEAAKRFPEDTDLLYDQAMMAERAGLPAEMERLLRELIARKPDHHHAYNALGYSLADRNERLPEAKALIEKAVAMAPNDAYIQDSLGWVEFRMGNKTRALSILKDAYAKRPDPEIAAHLGEVLWVLGQRDEALRIWREGLLIASDNETLQATLKRLNAQP